MDSEPDSRPGAPQIAIVLKDGQWFIRSIAYTVHDDVEGEMVYHCDKNLGGPFASWREHGKCRRCLSCVSDQVEAARMAKAQYQADLAEWCRAMPADAANTIEALMKALREIELRTAAYADAPDWPLVSGVHAVARDAIKSHS